MAYNWTDQSGSHGSVKQLSQDPGNLVPVSPALLPLRSELPVTQIGRCGPELKTICKGSVFGDCCSQYNTCGSTAEYCGSGCQGAYGKCAKPNIFANEKLEFEPEPSTSVKKITSTTTITSSTSTSKSTSTTTSTSTSQSTSSSAKTSTTTSAAPLRTDLPLTPNGHCGPNVKTICKGSVFGDCCSEYNYCGNGPDYCGTGCQSAFGRCGDAPVEPKAATTSSTSQLSKVATIPVSSSSTSSSTSISTSTTTTTETAASTAAPGNNNPVVNVKLAVSEDGSCGGKDAKFTCTGGIYGECCSQYNFWYVLV